MGKTTSVKEILYGDVSKYSKLLEPIAASLEQKYNLPDFSAYFKSIPQRSITVGPMRFCDALCQDLNSQAPDILLQAVGLLCFHISTHDDLIDEPPSTQRNKSALLYAGTITAIEGTILLQKAIKPSHAQHILDQINRNHLLQHECVIKLWEGKPRNFEEYYSGVEHDSAMAAIAVKAALCQAEKLELWPKFDSFCRAYGTAFQLLDDISEVEEDRLSGYHSFPLLEGFPYTKSFDKVSEHSLNAEKLLDSSWTNVREIINGMHQLKKKLQDESRA